MKINTNNSTLKTEGLTQAIKDSKKSSLTRNLSKIAVTMLIALTMGTTSLLTTGCNNSVNEDSSIATPDETNQETSLKEDVNYILVNFGNSVQVLGVKDVIRTYSHQAGTLYFDVEFQDGTYLENIDRSNLWDFDETSQEQVDMVNNILIDNKVEETFPYTYVKSKQK